MAAGKREAHGAEAARSHQRARLVVVVILRLPHLVLAHVGDDDGFAVCFLPQIIDDVRGIEWPVSGRP